MQCKIIRRVDLALQRHIPRYKLWRISKAIGIKPHPWQRKFALGKSSYLYGRTERATGKTMAVMLRVLLRNDGLVKPYMFADDPDWLECDSPRTRWYYREYHRLSGRCISAGIFVPLIPLNYSRRT